MYNVVNSIITDRKMYRCIFKVSFYFRGSLYEINVLLTLFLQIEVSIVIDEMSMGHKHVSECLDRSLQDVRKNKNPFGGVTVLFVGGWRQILPVVRHGSREKLVGATLKHSFLWRRSKSFSLTKNTRVATLGTDSEDFAKFPESVGSGDLGVGGSRSKKQDRKSELVLRSTYQIF